MIITSVSNDAPSTGTGDRSVAANFTSMHPTHRICHNTICLKFRLYGRLHESQSKIMSYFKHLNPYEIHQKLINDYILKRPGDTKKLFVRDASKDKTDIDVIRENHKFLWDDEEDTIDSWEKQLAKRYYDKLFKEYCIADLSRYRENKIALRWRIDKEVVSGKGQFICGNKKCDERNRLRSWEVNFAYVEHGEKKNALIKLRLCPECSLKLNYHSQKREIKRMKKRSKMERKSKRHRTDELDSSNAGIASTSSRTEKSHSENDSDQPSDDGHSDTTMEPVAAAVTQNLERECWTATTSLEEKSREEEFDDYLADLLL